MKVEGLMLRVEGLMFSVERVTSLYSQHSSLNTMCDLHEADAFVCLLPTANAVGYAATAPTGLAPSATSYYTQ